MGCWNETCMLSHLPIFCGDNIKTIILVKKHDKPCSEKVYFDDGYTPIVFPFNAEYNDYGGIENPIISDYTIRQLKLLELVDHNGEKYNFASIEQLVDDINDDGVYLKTMFSIGRLECVYIHKKLYDTLISKMAKRIPYEQIKTIGELLTEKYNNAKTKWLEVLKKQNGSIELEDCMIIRFIETTFGNSNGFYDFIQDLIIKNLINIDELDDFVKEACRYRLFTYTLSEGRIGYITRCGTGSQDTSLFTQKIIAEYIISESERKSEDGDFIYSDEETLFWFN